MSRLPLLLLAVAVGATAAFFLLRSGGERPAGDLAGAYARALAYYQNETNQDDRRARLELLPFAAALEDSVEWRLDMALIDLAEYNHPVQDEGRLKGDGGTHLLESSREHLERARALSPGREAVLYNLARTYRKLAASARDDAALRRAAEECLRPLVALGQPDPAAMLLFGDLRDEAGDHAGAFEAYGRIVALGSDHVPKTLFVVAAGKSANALIRLDREKGVAAIEQFNRDHPDRPRPSADALERGAHTRLRELAPARPTRPDPRALGWLDVTARSGLPEAGTPRFLIAPDLDGDCARDVVMMAKQGLCVLRNRRDASFEDLTASSGLPADLAVGAGASGDLDGDGKADLVVGGPGGVRLFLNVTPDDEGTKWRFVDYTNDAEGKPRLGPGGALPADCLLLLDFDHDGDLDLFAGGRPNRLWRMVIEAPAEGGKYLRFEEVATTLGIQEPPAAEATLLDVEDDHDIDLLVAGPEGNAWFENLRELRFRKHLLPPGRGLMAFDHDNDQREDLLIGRRVFSWKGGAFAEGPERDLLLDLDGDGVADADPLAGIGASASEVVTAIGADLNRDGDSDLLLLDNKGLREFLSRPKIPAAWIDVRPRGLGTNEFGIGTKVRLFCGDLRIAATCRDGLLSFGLGKRTRIDALLLRWTNGVEQGVVGPQVASCLEIEEREGEVGSCPFLYAFDGERWHFVADCHSGTPLGLPYADGKYLPPRSNETVYIDGAMLRPVEGRLRLDLAEEFRELFYVDAVTLRAIDHPAAVRPVLNEGFRIFSFPEFRVYGLSDLRPPLSAKDHKGRDVLADVARRDGRHAVVFDRLDGQYEGLARPWAITLDFGDLPRGGRLLLVMDGWVEFPTASASIAASRSETVRFQPPVLEAIGPDGAWTVIDKDPGFPAGKGKAVLVDLTGKLPGTDGRLRISSTQRLHWDAFQISTGADEEIRLTELPLHAAHHRFRGVGKRIESPGREQPWRYSHDDLESFYRWDQMPMGMLTRYGDVAALLREIDDRYPVLASGDVVELSFDADSLPPLPEGWVRDWCFTTEGWVKDADLNQAVRESVTPLPFHAMSRYPYDEAAERHPHPDWVAEWFTRETRRLVNPDALR